MQLARASIFFLSFLIAILLSPAFSSDSWFIRAGPDKENIDYVPNGGEISISEISGAIFSSEKITFSGNERFYLKSATQNFSAGANYSLEIEFSAEELTANLVQFSGESGEIVYENPVSVSEGSAEAAFEGPLVSLNSRGDGRKVLSVSGIIFPEDGPGALFLKAKDGEIHSVRGLASFLPEKRIRPWALYSSAGVLGALAIMISLRIFSSGRRKAEESKVDEKARREDLNEIQRSIFGKR